MRVLFKYKRYNRKNIFFGTFMKIF